MRKHDVRKWLHAVLDLLPVILIPVFMIYSHRHTIDSGSIDVPQNQVVDFNQVVNVGSYDHYNTGGFSFTSINTYTLQVDNISRGYVSLRLNTYPVQSGHKYLLKSNSDYLYYLDKDTGDTITNFTRNTIFTYNGSDNGFFSLEGSVTETGYIYFSFYDLTQMFGSGNEPTLQQFDSWYSPYNDYTLSHKELLKDTSTITYDDTDIMSQVVYQLYNSVDKYFNMGNVFNMTGVYDWFNLNIFNGNAPISIFIVWNIVLYEFVMDLLFLLYGLFMWFIDMVEKLMEKPLKSVK